MLSGQFISLVRWSTPTLGRNLKRCRVRATWVCLRQVENCLLATREKTCCKRLLSTNSCRRVTARKSNLGLERPLQTVRKTLWSCILGRGRPYVVARVLV